MAKKLKQEYYEMIIEDNSIVGKLIVIFDRDGQSIKRWARQKRFELNSIEVLEVLKDRLFETKGIEIENLNELFTDEN